jgi:carbohydrate kinase (thermoresistant glucokinase family)
MMLVVLGGVSGSGKSRVGKRMAELVDGRFFDGDDFHPPANKEKMSRQEALTDADRQPWLQAMANLLSERLELPQPTILACSALKPEYRRLLRVDPRIRIALLDVPREVLQQRLAARKGHFFPPELLDSQLQTLVKPVDEPLTRMIPANRPVDELARDIIQWCQEKT